MSILKKLLYALLVALSIDELKEEAQVLFSGICRFYAIQFTLDNLNSQLFIDTLIDGITSQNRALKEPVLGALNFLIKTCNELEIEPSGNPNFDYIAKQIAHCAYRSEWYYKSGACNAIEFLTSKLSTKWILKHQVIFVKSLLFVLKDVAPEVSVLTIEEASSALFFLLKKCNQSGKPVEFIEQFESVLSILTTELSSPNSTVRSNVQKSLRIISELTNESITQLVEPFKSTLFSPIFAKQLRMLSLVVQTGYIDALSFCLNLRPPLVSFTPELNRLLQGALAIAEKELETISSTKTVPIKIFQTRRIVAIELLTAAMGCPEFQGAEYQEIRHKIIGIFIKALTFRIPEVVNAAKKGLRIVVQQQKLPKELLQNSLRPILINLSDYRKLSVPLLQGLARLLSLLNSWFNVALGEKLFQHLHHWTDPMKAGITKWKDGEEFRIAAAILEIFHLLPSPAASKFLDSLIDCTIQLERSLPREVSSPYREPLVKYLNQYPSQAVESFLQKLSQPLYSKLFRFLLRNELAQPLREELAKNPQRLIKSIFKVVASTPEHIAEVHFQGVCIVRTLVKFMPKWLSEPQNRQIVDCLIELWRAPKRLERLNSDALPLHQIRESKLIVKCFLNYCSHHREEVDILFHMLSIFTIRTTIDYNFLKDFYTYEVPEKYSSQQKKAILLRFLQFFKDPSFTQQHKVRALKIMVIPMLNAAFNKNDYVDIIDQRIIAAIISEILDPKPTPGESHDESLNIELLQLATLLVRNLATELVEHRKELIKFAWSHLRSDDTTARQCAYVLVCRFIEAYETPAKIILQVYVALLRAFQPEAKNLVQQALDILLQALQKRLPAGNDLKFPTWIKWTKKIIVDEGHSLPQLIHILSLIVRHPSQFYPYRGQFIPHMVNSLPRIGLLPNSAPENRKLAVELAYLIIKWEAQRIQDIKNTNNHLSKIIPDVNIDSMETDDSHPKSEASGPSETSSTSSQTQKSPNVETEFRVNSVIAEMIVNFLIRIASNCSESNQEQKKLAASSLEMLKEGLVLWPEASVKFNYFLKILTTEQPEIVCTGLKILAVIVDHQSPQAIRDTMNELQSVLLPCFSSAEMKIVTSLCSLLERVIKVHPLNSVELATFYKSITDTLKSNLNNYLNNGNNIQQSVAILQVLYSNSVQVQNEFLPEIVKVIHKLTKELLSPPNSKDTSDITRLSVSGTNKKASRDLGQIVLQLISMVNLHMNDLKENSHTFFESIIMIIEKSNDVELLTDLTNIVNNWVHQTAEGVLKLKTNDLVQLLQKMARFDQLSSPSLHTSFLEIIYFMYTHPGFQNEASQLENAFMMGLRHKDVHIREKFFQRFQQNIKRTVADRLVHIFETQNWENMGSYFWIRQALDLLFVLINQENSFSISSTISNYAMDIDETHTQKSSSSIYQQNQEFISSLQQNSIKEALVPLIELYHQDVDIARTLWVELFPQLWESLSITKQDVLSECFPIFLTKEYHLKQKNSLNGPNVIQTIIDGFDSCHPRPYIPIEVLKYLGKTYNVWHTCIKMLEDNMLSNSPTPGVDLAIAELYSLLSEDDLYFALWKKRCSRETIPALTFEQYGFWQKSQEEYFQLMSKAESGSITSVTPYETCFWEEHWINCAKRLNQWDLLNEYARSHGHVELLVESAWKVGDWDSMRNCLTIMSNEGIENYLTKLYQCYTAIQDSKVQDIENVFSQSMSMSLRHLQILSSRPSVAHIPILSYFQQAVEVKESLQILHDINGSNKVQSIPDIKGILTTWRERLPNKWDDSLVWFDLLRWRQHVFSLLNNAFASEGNSNAAHLGYHETGWTLNKFAHIARKQGSEEIALNTLQEIYNLPNIEIQDAFVKLKEQAQCYIAQGKNYRLALDHINKVNLDYFSPIQKSEFFELKGKIFQQMGHKEDAHSAFSTAVSLYDNSAKGWCSWGIYCDQRFMESKDLTWAEYAITCFLNGIRCGSDKARRMLSRVFWMLSFDDENQRLCKTFEKLSGHCMNWIWIPWIPQILSGLSRPEAPQMKEILSKLASAFPQAVFYTLRAYLHGKKEIESLYSPSMEMDFHGRGSKQQKSQQPNPNLLSSSKASKPVQTNAIKFAEEVLARMKATHVSLVPDMEFMVKEIIHCMQSEREEGLLTVLKEFMYNIHKYVTNNTSDEMPNQLLQKLEAINQKLFPPFLSGSSSSLSTINRKFPEFLQKYKKSFENDFLKQTSISQVIENLKKWISQLEQIVSQYPKKYNLEDLCQKFSNGSFLVEFHNPLIEIPGQYTKDAEPMADYHPRIDRFYPEVTVTGETRCLQFRANNGKLYPFSVHLIPDIPVLFNDRPGENILQFYRFFSIFLNKHKEYRRRNINFQLPAVVPLAPRAKLVQTNLECVTLQDIYSEHCKYQEKDLFAPLDTYREGLKKGLPKLQMYEKICQENVPDDILLKFVAKILPSYMDLFHFKKNFVSQLAVSSYLDYVLGIGKRRLENISFVKDHGGIYQLSFHPEYSPQGEIQNREAVPFRLTRNFQTLMHPIFCGGIFESSLTATSLCFTKYQEQLFSILSTLLRDDFLEWQLSKSVDTELSQNDAEPRKKLKECVENNLNKIKERVQTIGPDFENPSALNQKILQLIEVAKDPQKLSEMEPSWHPWM